MILRWWGGWDYCGVGERDTQLTFQRHWEPAPTLPLSRFLFKIYINTFSFLIGFLKFLHLVFWVNFLYSGIQIDPVRISELQVDSQTIVFFFLKCLACKGNLGYFVLHFQLFHWLLPWTKKHMIKIDDLSSSFFLTLRRYYFLKNNSGRRVRIFNI